MTICVYRMIEQKKTSEISYTTIVYKIFFISGAFLCLSIILILKNNDEIKAHGCQIILGKQNTK